VSKHPYVKEAERLVDQARSAGATTGNLHWDPDANGGGGDFTPERKRVHAEIAAHTLNPNAAAKDGERPQVAFVLGPPGSGKTTMGRPAARAAMGLPQDRTTTLDPDEVKMSLPEYRGWNAALVHDESAEVFDRMLEDAVKNKHHIVFDTTGRSEEFMTSMLDKFSKAGYDAHLVHTHLSGEQSAQRAVKRFVEQAFQDDPDPEKRGRYVPVGFIAQHINGHPEKVYNKLREDPRVKSWVSYDANNIKAGKIRNSGSRESVHEATERTERAAA
jgi:adenylate kinase family enzyme